MTQQTIHIGIEGMHCQSCETLIREELLTVTGVSDAAVSHTSKDALVTWSGDTSPTLLLDAVKRAGYEGRVLTNGKTISQAMPDAEKPIPVKVTVETQLAPKEFVNLMSIFSAKPIATATDEAKDVSSKAINPARGMERIKLDITGMHCSSCAGLIER